jgi:hypothetical protein
MAGRDGSSHIREVPTHAISEDLYGLHGLQDRMLCIALRSTGRDGYRFLLANVMRRSGEVTATLRVHGRSRTDLHARGSAW